MGWAVTSLLWLCVTSHHCLPTPLAPTLPPVLPPLAPSPPLRVLHVLLLPHRAGCRYDGVSSVESCPVLPGTSFTYRFQVNEPPGQQ